MLNHLKNITLLVGSAGTTGSIAIAWMSSSIPHMYWALGFLLITFLVIWFLDNVGP